VSGVPTRPTQWLKRLPSKPHQFSPGKLGISPRSFGPVCASHRNCLCSTRSSHLDGRSDVRRARSRARSRVPSCPRRHAGTRHGWEGNNRKCYGNARERPARMRPGRGHISDHHQMSRTCYSVMLARPTRAEAKRCLSWEERHFSANVPHCRAIPDTCTVVGRKIKQTRRNCEGWRAG
jgi:hypothetical protein